MNAPKRNLFIGVGVAVIAAAAVAGFLFFDVFSDASRVVALVNDEPITHQQVQARRHQMLVRGVTGGLSVPEDALYDRALDDLITEALLYQDALTRDISPDPELVEARYRSTRDNYESEREYRERLASNFLTDDQFRQNIKRQVVLIEYFQQLARERVLGSGEDTIESVSPDGTRLTVEAEAELTQALVNQLAQERFNELSEEADIQVFRTGS